MINKALRRKQRGIKNTFQAAGFQPAIAPRGEELNPKEIKKMKVDGNKLRNFEHSLLIEVFTTINSCIKLAKIVTKHQLLQLVPDSANSIDSHR